jgi:hypothetical protein
LVDRHRFKRLLPSLARKGDRRFFRSLVLRCLRQGGHALRHRQGRARQFAEIEDSARSGNWQKGSFPANAICRSRGEDASTPSATETAIRTVETVIKSQTIRRRWFRAAQLIGPRGLPPRRRRLPVMDSPRHLGVGRTLTLLRGARQFMILEVPWSIEDSSLDGHRTRGLRALRPHRQARRGAAGAAIRSSARTQIARDKRSCKLLSVFGTMRTWRPLTLSSRPNSSRPEFTCPAVARLVAQLGNQELNR